MTRPTRDTLIRELDMTRDQLELARTEAARHKARVGRLEECVAAWRRLADVFCAQRDAAGTPGGPSVSTVAMLHEQFVERGSRVESLMRELFASVYDAQGPQTAAQDKRTN